MYRFLLFILMSLVFQSVNAQKDRYRFAATYFGLETGLNEENNKCNSFGNEGKINNKKPWNNL